MIDILPLLNSPKTNPLGSPKSPPPSLVTNAEFLKLEDENN